jgi:hypothetical protein
LVRQARGVVLACAMLLAAAGVFCARAEPNAAVPSSQTHAEHAANAARSTYASAPLPAGYTSESDHGVRWTYPLAAADEVRSLRNNHARAWRRVVTELGIQVPGELDIRVATTPEQMRGLVAPDTALPGYADGIAFRETGLILLTLTEPDTFLRPDMQTVMTHELSHVALYRAVRGAALPRWFVEGVAVQQAREGSFNRLRTLWEGTLRGGLLSLDLLSNDFPARRSDVDLAYAQSADFVGFMMAGSDERARFRGLLRALSQGRAFPDAVQDAYKVPLSYMEREWRTTLTQRFGRWPVLFMGLTSIWVLGAVLLVVGYARARARHRSTLARWAIQEAPVVQPVVSTPPPPPVPAGAVQSSLDDFFDNRRTKHDPGVPTVVHDGRSHTLH